MASTGVYKYTTSVQMKILTVLWRDEQAYSIYRDAIKPKYFEKPEHVDLCRILFDYIEKYHRSPTLDVLVEEVSVLCDKSKTKKKLEDDYIKCLEQMSNADLSDIDYIKDKILSFGKRQALVDAVLESADILEKEPEAEYPKIRGKFDEAMRVGENVNDLGTDVFENIRERIEGYTDEEDVIERIPTGMSELDRATGGGLGRTEMGVVVAPPGKGKTTFLTSVASSAVDNGYNVLHISMENNEKQVVRNYDTRLLKKPFDYIRENTENSIKALLNIKKLKKGRLIVKKYPTKGASVTTVRNLLEQLRLVKNFVPDLIVIDYGAIMKPERNYNDKRSGIEGIYEDIRALADDYNCGVWTAAQGNRASLSKKIVTISDIAECFAIANVADVVFALCQSLKEKSQGIIRGFLAKCRDNGDSIIMKGRILYEIKKIDYDEVVDVEALQDSDDEDGEEDEDW